MPLTRKKKRLPMFAPMAKANTEQKTQRGLNKHEQDSGQTNPPG